jgi:hypothetical protein
MSLADWAKEIGMNERTLRERCRRGWSPAAILTRHLADRLHLKWCGTRLKGLGKEHLKKKST